jgi:hypothetical protein
VAVACSGEEEAAFPSMGITIGAHSGHWFGALRVRATKHFARPSAPDPLLRTYVGVSDVWPTAALNEHRLVCACRFSGPFHESQNVFRAVD